CGVDHLHHPGRAAGTAAGPSGGLRAGHGVPRRFPGHAARHVARLAARPAVAGQPGGGRADIPGRARRLVRSWPTPQGPHNAENAASAMAVCRALGLTDDAIEQGLRTYPGLPHRMELIAEHNGVLFVNDSKATNPASTAPALAAYPRVHWICGGLPKTD